MPLDTMIPDSLELLAMFETAAAQATAEWHSERDLNANLEQDFILAANAAAVEEIIFKNNR